MMAYSQPSGHTFSIGKSWSFGNQGMTFFRKSDSETANFWGNSIEITQKSSMKLDVTFPGNSAIATFLGW